MKDAYGIPGVRATLDTLPLYDQEGRQVRLISRISVADVYRGKGHAKALLAAVCADADAEGVTLVLSAQPETPDIEVHRLVRLYQQFGFRVESYADGFPVMDRKPQPRPKEQSKGTP